MKRTPNPETASLLQALFHNDPAVWEQWKKQRGIPQTPDEETYLDMIPIDQWQDFTKIAPTPAIQKYLASGDVLTNFAIDQMEISMESAFGVTDPWFVNCERHGAQDEDAQEAVGPLTVDCFRLLKESPRS